MSHRSTLSHPRTKALLLLLAGTCACVPSRADEAPSTEMDQMLDTTRQSVRSTTEWLARGIDGWFGDRPFSDGGKVSDGELSPGLVARQGESPEYSLRFNARLRLPNLEHGTFLFIGRDDPRDVATDAPGAFSRQQPALQRGATDPSFFAGFGTQLLGDAVQLRAGFRGGAKPYLQARYERPWRLGASTLVDFRETVFWTRDDQFGSTTALSLDHALSSTLAIRWLSAATITLQTDHLERHSSLGLYRDFGAERVLSAETLYASELPSGARVANYGLQLRWSQPVHRDWVIGEVLLGRFFAFSPPPGERSAAWAVGGRLTMRF